jgi:predicted MFS family arabinose efflux permease
MAACSRCGVGVGEVGCGPPSHSLLTNYFGPHKRTMALPVYGLGVPIGVLIGSVAGGWIAQHYGWRAALMIVGLPGLFIAILLKLTVREPARGASDLVAAAALPRSLGEVLTLLFSTPAFRHMAAGLVVFSIGMSGINGFMAPYFSRRFALNYATGGLIVGIVYSFAGVVVSALAEAILRNGRDATIGASIWSLRQSASRAAGFLMLAFVQTSWPWLAALMLVPQLLSATYMARVFAVTHNMVDARMRATDAATLLFLMNMVGMSLGPTAGWRLSDLLSAHAFPGPVAFAEGCPGGAALAGGAPALADACRIVLGDGTRMALMLCTPIILSSAVHYYLASRLVIRDLAGGDDT